MTLDFITFSFVAFANLISFLCGLGLVRAGIQSIFFKCTKGFDWEGAFCLIGGAVVLITCSATAGMTIGVASLGATLCDWDMKTGLRKQCVKRLVKEVANALDPAYITAANQDPDLVQGKETYSCYTQGKEVNDVMLLSNVKDETTTVTSEYTKLDIPAGFAYSDALPIPTSQ